MKVICQKVASSSVKVNNNLVSKIDKGMLLLVGFSKDDQKSLIPKMALKIVNLRIFDDENKVMNKSLLDVKGEILSVSQFTLCANTSKGNRPSYVDAMEYTKAKEFYDLFNKELRKYNLTVKEGIFRENMQVSLINDGPVTIILEK